MESQVRGLSPVRLGLVQNGHVRGLSPLGEFSRGAAVADLRDALLAEARPPTRARPRLTPPPGSTPERYPYASPSQ